MFLTPRGDCRGLYVASQAASGFEVRELQGGTSTLGFTYRIMAHRKDLAAPRLERVTRPAPAALGGPGVSPPTGTTPTVATPAPSATPQPPSTQTATPTPTTLPTPGSAGSPSAT